MIFYEDGEELSAEDQIAMENKFFMDLKEVLPDVAELYLSTGKWTYDPKIGYTKT